MGIVCRRNTSHCSWRQSAARKPSETGTTTMRARDIRMRSMHTLSARTNWRTPKRPRIASPATRTIHVTHLSRGADDATSPRDSPDLGALPALTQALGPNGPGAFCFPGRQSKAPRLPVALRPTERAQSTARHSTPRQLASPPRMPLNELLRRRGYPTRPELASSILGLSQARQSASAVSPVEWRTALAGVRVHGRPSRATQPTHRAYRGARPRASRKRMRMTLTA